MNLLSILVVLLPWMAMSLQTVIRAQDCTSSIGVPSKLATFTLNNGGGNMCTESGSTVTYWCYNEPGTSKTGAIYSSLSFDFVSTAATFSNTASQVLVGLNYGGATDYSVVIITIDGLQSFGSILTPPLSQPGVFATAVAELPVAVSPGQHQITVEVQRGGIYITSIIISNTPIASAMSNQYPAGSVLINAQDFTFASSPVGFIRNANADATFRGAHLINFCFNSLTPNVDYWCYNAPVGGPYGEMSYIEFNFACPSEGWYYLGFSYGTSDPDASLIFLLDGVQVFGNPPTPMVSNFGTVFSPISSYMFKGTRVIRAQVTNGNINLNSIIVTPTVGPAQVHECQVDLDCPVLGYICVRGTCLNSSLTQNFLTLNKLGDIVVGSGVGGLLLIWFVIIPFISVVSSTVMEGKIATKSKVNKPKSNKLPIPPAANNTTVIVNEPKPKSVPPPPPPMPSTITTLNSILPSATIKAEPKSNALGGKLLVDTTILNHGTEHKPISTKRAKRMVEGIPGLETKEYI